MTAVLPPAEERKVWAQAIVVGFAALTIVSMLYVSISTHALASSIRAEQVQNTSRVQNAANTLVIVKAVEATLTTNHSTSYPILVSICHALPGCVVPPTPRR
jgi:hypothetical protein